MGQRFSLPGSQHSTRRIVMVYFWAVLHDRPISWALQRCHWPAKGVHLPLPSNATMSRRLRRCQTQALLAAALAHLRGELAGDQRVLYLDGKPLVIGGLGGDPDASVGYGAGKRCRGYKLHALCDGAGLPVAHLVTTMRVPEWQAARRLVRQLGRQKGYVVADGNYDKTVLYVRVGRLGRQLVARRHQGQGLGHRRQSPHRLSSLTLAPAVREQLLRQRGVIERMFAQLCAPAGGLGPLGAWVRREHRVQRWVQAKLILYCLRLLLRRQSQPEVA